MVHTYLYIYRQAKILNDDDVYSVRPRQEIDRRLAELLEEAEFVRLHVLLGK